MMTKSRAGCKKAGSDPALPRSPEAENLSLLGRLLGLAASDPPLSSGFPLNRAGRAAKYCVYWPGSTL